MNDIVIEFIENFCSDNRIDIKELQNRSRKFETTLLRHLLMYLLRMRFGLSLEAVGRYFNRDHSTVLNAMYKIADMIYVKDAVLEPYKKYLHSKTIYLSGAISNLDYTDVMYRFLEAENKLRKNGNNVISPLRLVNKDESHPNAMKICIRNLLTCEAIYMLKGWEQSVGATLEHRIAKVCGLEVMYEREDNAD